MSLVWFVQALTCTKACASCKYCEYLQVCRKQVKDCYILLVLKQDPVSASVVERVDICVTLFLLAWPSSIDFPVDFSPASPWHLDILTSWSWWLLDGLLWIMEPEGSLGVTFWCLGQVCFSILQQRGRTQTCWINCSAGIWCASGDRCRRKKWRYQRYRRYHTF